MNVMNITVNHEYIILEHILRCILTPTLFAFCIMYAGNLASIPVIPINGWSGNGELPLS